MKFSSSLVLGCLSLCQALPASTSNEKKAAKPAAFFLAGDSTTAAAGGWGNGFLKLLTNGAIGTNFAQRGRTTVSFVSEGFWDQTIAAVKTNAANYTPYVTIQVCCPDETSKNPITNLTENSLATTIKKQKQISVSLSSK